MDDLMYVYAIGLIPAALLAFEVVTKRFDPFAPIWLFFVGYVHLYMLEALNLRERALGVRGIEIVREASFRGVLGAPVVSVRLLRRAGTAACAVSSEAAARVVVAGGHGTDARVDRDRIVLHHHDDANGVFRYRPGLRGSGAGGFVPVRDDGGRDHADRLGRDPTAPKPIVLALGVATAFAYVMLWMFNGKRSPSLIGALSGICAFYIARQKRPSWPVLLATAFIGAMIVSVAITWRFNRGHYDRTASGFIQFVSEFDVSQILNALGERRRGSRPFQVHLARIARVRRISPDARRRPRAAPITTTEPITFAASRRSSPALFGRTSRSTAGRNGSRPGLRARN